MTTGDPAATRRSAGQAFGVDPGRVLRVGEDELEFVPMLWEFVPMP